MMRSGLDRVEFGRLPDPESAQAVEGLPCSDFSDPGGEALGIFQLLQGAEEFEEGVLKDVFRLFSTWEDPAGDGVDQFLVPAEEFFMGPALTQTSAVQDEGEAGIHQHNRRIKGKKGCMLAAGFLGVFPTGALKKIESRETVTRNSLAFVLRARGERLSFIVSCSSPFGFPVFSLHHSRLKILRILDILRHRPYR